jgi:hypothetical protein
MPDERELMVRVNKGEQRALKMLRLKGGRPL